MKKKLRILPTIYCLTTLIQICHAMEPDSNMLNQEQSLATFENYIPHEIVIDHIVPHCPLDSLLSLKCISQSFYQTIDFNNSTTQFLKHITFHDIEKETKALIFIAHTDNLRLFHELLRRSSFLFYHLYNSTKFTPVCSEPDVPADMIESLINKDEIVPLIHDNKTFKFTNYYNVTFNFTNKNILEVCPFIKNVYSGNFNHDFLENVDAQKKLILAMLTNKMESIIDPILFKSYHRNINTCLYLQSQNFNPMIQFIEFFLEAGADVNAAMPNISYKAINTLNIKLLEIILDYEPNLHAENAEKITPFICACIKRSKCSGNSSARMIEELDIHTIIKMLLKSKIDINHQDARGFSGLHHLASCWYQDNITKTITRLLDNKINTNLTDHNNNTALHCAIDMQRLPVIKLLLDHVHRIQCPSLNVKNKDGNTPLMIAYKKYQQNTDYEEGKQVCAEILTYNPDVCTVNNKGESVLSLAITDNNINRLININHQDRQGRTILHTIIEECNYALALELIEKYSPDLTLIDHNKNTLLHTLAFTCKYIPSSIKRAHATKLLINKLILLAQEKNNEEKTPVDIANQLKHTDFLACLLATQ